MHAFADLIAAMGWRVFGLAALFLGVGVLVGGGQLWVGLLLLVTGAATLIGSWVQSRRREPGEHLPLRGSA